MGTINTNATAVDTAVASLGTAVATLVTSTNAKDVAGRSSARNQPHPLYEDVGRVLRAALMSNASLRPFLVGFIPNLPVTTVAGSFPASD